MFMITDPAALVVFLTTAVAAGLIGCFAVMRRMALAADALSHFALPGIGIAIALHIHPLFGAAAMLFVGALFVWALEERTGIPTDTVIGVVFSAALAVGSMMTSGEDLIDALFGRRGPVSGAELAFGLIAPVAVIVFVLVRRHHLLVALVSPDLARTAGINVQRLNLIYMQMFALTVALGLRHLGILLMGSLIIIPAATSRRLAKNLGQMLVLSSVIAAAATLVGSLLAPALGQEPGPVIVTVAALGFLLSFARRPV
jgi:ABC-type Mn2+/Zn2+ transport system permease subunit